MRRTIDGNPYTITRIGDSGYRVTAGTSPTDRFYRSYFVRIGIDGAPQHCTCPHQIYRGGECKHMREITALLQEQSSSC